MDEEIEYTQRCIRLDFNERLDEAKMMKIVDLLEKQLVEELGLDVDILWIE